MERMFRRDEEEDDPTPLIESSVPSMKELLHDAPPQHPIVEWLQERSSFLLMPVLPLLWCVLLISTLDRNMLLSAAAMPLLGIGSATLANMVPVGGGIVFVPILTLCGIELKLGAAFAVATMTFGNGVFGFLSWLQKDPKSIAWHVVPYAVFPAWIGATWSTLYPFLAPAYCRDLFAMFCLKVAILVGRGIVIARKNYKPHHTQATFSIFQADHDNARHSSSEELPPNVLRQRQMWASVCSFLAGSVLVAHIGIGNAMTTFLVCSLVWKLPPKHCVVTGILCGGWTSACPFLLHLCLRRDVPIALWVMGLPGVYIGARIAPWFHEKMGILNVLTAFCGFLIVTALLMLAI